MNKQRICIRLEKGWVGKERELAEDRQQYHTALNYLLATA